MRLLVTLSTPAEGLSQLMPQFRKLSLHFDYNPPPCSPLISLASGTWSWRQSLVALPLPPWFLRVLQSRTSSITDTLSHTHLQLQSCPRPSANMYSLRHFHIWLYTQLLALTSSYDQSVTPTLNYNHTLTLPIQLHHQCCPHPVPPPPNYNHMWLNLQFCTYGIILHWHSHPLMLNSLHWDARLLVTFMHAWKHQISSFILTAEWFLVFLSATQREPTFCQGTEWLTVPVECCLPRKSPWIFILYLLKNVCCGWFSFST